MKKKLTLLLAVGFTLAVIGNILFLIQNYERSRVVSVPDGDSLDLADGRRIRLLGIDAPERGRCMAEEARAKLIDLALGRHVRLKEIVKDDHGRQLAVVIVEEPRVWVSYLLNRFSSTFRLPSSTIHLLSSIFHLPTQDPLLQRALLTAGLVRNRSGTSNPYAQVLKDAQEVARSAKLGIWSDACRGKTSGKDDCTIKANTRAGKKYYYTPECPTYEQVVVDTSFGDAWLCTQAEATKSGFTKAASCN